MHGGQDGGKGLARCPIARQGHSYIQSVGAGLSAMERKRPQKHRSLPRSTGYRQQRRLPEDNLGRWQLANERHDPLTQFTGQRQPRVAVAVALLAHVPRGDTQHVVHAIDQG